MAPDLCATNRKLRSFIDQGNRHVKCSAKRRPLPKPLKRLSYNQHS
jgi:hypothetical protein